MRVTGLNGRPCHLASNWRQRYGVDWDRKVSGPQKAVKDFLRPYWDRPGIIVTEETVLPGCGRALRMDLMNWNRRIAIEVSPASSHAYNQFFHKHRVGFGAAVKRDLDKGRWAELNRFTFVELNEADIAQLSAAWLLKTYQIEL